MIIRHLVVPSILYYCYKYKLIDNSYDVMFTNSVRTLRSISLCVNSVYKIKLFIKILMWATFRLITPITVFFL